MSAFRSNAKRLPGPCSQRRLPTHNRPASLRPLRLIPALIKKTAKDAEDAEDCMASNTLNNSTTTIA